MKFMRVKAVARKEFLHVIRDSRSMALALALPLLFMLLFGYALTLDVDNVPTIVWDQDNTATSREFISMFSGSPYFDIRHVTQGYREITGAVDEGTALLAIVVPQGFERGVKTGRTASVQVIADGSDSNTATFALGYVDSVAAAYSAKVLTARANATGGQAAVRAPADLRPRMWFNSDMQSKNFIIPGLIAVVMTIIAALITSLTFAREWETGTMEQLISTPVRGVELIIGKMAPYFVIGLTDVLLSLVGGIVLFHVPLRGSVVQVFAVSSIFLFGALSVGMLISIGTKSQLLASQISMVATYLPSFLLSGFMFSVENMSKFIYVLSHIVPARYFIKLLRSIYLKGLGMETLVYETMLLVVFGVIVFAMANRKFRKKME